MCVLLRICVVLGVTRICAALATQVHGYCFSLIELCFLHSLYSCQKPFPMPTGRSLARVVTGPAQASPPRVFNA
jgi:hypothetical protein